MRNNGKGRMNGMGNMNGMNFGFGMAETREEALQMMNMMMNMAGQINPADSDEDYDPFNVIEDEDDWDDDDDDIEEDDEDDYEDVDWSKPPYTTKNIQHGTGEIKTTKELFQAYLAKLAKAPFTNASLSFNDFLINNGWRVKR